MLLALSAAQVSVVVKLPPAASEKPVLVDHVAAGAGGKIGQVPALGGGHRRRRGLDELRRAAGHGNGRSGGVFAGVEGDHRVVDVDDAGAVHRVQRMTAGGRVGGREVVGGLYRAVQQQRLDRAEIDRVGAVLRGGAGPAAAPRLHQQRGGAGDDGGGAAGDDLRRRDVGLSSAVRRWANRLHHRRGVDADDVVGVGRRTGRAAIARGGDEDRVVLVGGGVERRVVAGIRIQEAHVDHLVGIGGQQVLQVVLGVVAVDMGHPRRHAG